MVVAVRCYSGVFVCLFGLFVCLIVSFEFWILYNFCGFIIYRLTQYPTQTLLIYTLVYCFVPCRLSMLNM